MSKFFVYYDVKNHPTWAAVERGRSEAPESHRVGVEDGEHPDVALGRFGWVRMSYWDRVWDDVWRAQVRPSQV